MMGSIQQLLGRFNGDQHGATLTEFVITLPVFVMTFVGVLHLFAIEDMALHGKATAYADSLTHFRTIQSDYIPFDWTVNPVSAGTRAGVWHNSVSQSRQRDRAADLVLDTVPIGAGHMMESYSRLLVSGPPSWAAETVQLDPAVAHMTVDSLMTENPTKSPVTGDTRYGIEMSGSADSIFAKPLMSDLVSINGLSNSKSWMAFVNNALTMTGARPAFAAGLRYGVAEGKHDETHTFMRRSWQVQTSTHIAAPSRPTSKWFPIVITRAKLGDSEAYDNDILAFEMRVNTSSEEADQAEECAASLESISITNPSSFGDALGLLGDIKDGDPCGNGAGGGVGSVLGFFTGPLSNAASFFGGSVPTSPTSGKVEQSGSFP